MSFSHFFLPVESNNHKAKTLHFSYLSFYISIFLIIQILLNLLPKSTSAVLGIASDISVERLLYLTNQKRIEEGLNPVKLNKNLSKAAEAKAKDMFNYNYWSHNSPQGKSPWDFIISSDYKYLYAGENLAKDFANSDGVVNAWMKSPSHKENILQEKYEDIGFAVVNGELDGEETTLVVQMFGTKEGSSKGVVAEGASDQNHLDKEKIVTNPQDKNPGQKFVIDTFQITKNISLILGFFLFIMVAIDTIFVYRKKIIRISGHNISHLIFLLGLVAAVWMTSGGEIV